MNKNGYVIVEGNIGVGKSTLCKYLQKAFEEAGVRAEYLPEPDETNNPFLDLYYKDPAAHAYEMQQHLLNARRSTTLWAALGASIGRGWFILDRSYYGDVCFARVQLENGYFTPAQFNSYLATHKTLRNEIADPSAAIFLKADVGTCNRRIAERARSCEAGIDPNYLEQLQRQIDRLELSMQRKTRVIHLDWNDPLEKESIMGEARLLVARLLNMQTDYFDF